MLWVTNVVVARGGNPKLKPLCSDDSEGARKTEGCLWQKFLFNLRSVDTYVPVSMVRGMRRGLLVGIGVVCAVGVVACLFSLRGIAA